jgi:drug/metabolite transporter (DMT)-like permease
LLIPACLLSGAGLSGFTRDTYIVLVLLAVIPQVVGHTTFNWALRFIPPTTVSILILGEPIGATILAYFVFGETVPARKGLGLLILAAGILFSARSEAPAAEAGKDQSPAL